VPMVGKITLTKDDVDKLYSLIVEGWRKCTTVI
jgi:hypothetical protein